MSNETLIIEERARDIGDFLVGRLLPFRKKRMIGPFIFIDHMGPSTLGNGVFMDIGNHPHIGLSTLTYLFEGEIEHRDSLGTVQRITPGDVNWMNAGSGVVHTERTPEDIRRSNHIHTVHGFQIWVANALEKEGDPAFFHHSPKTALPSWEEDHVSYRLIAGKAFGETSPVPVHSECFMMEIKSRKAKRISTKGKLNGEIGWCLVKGSVKACGEEISAGNLLYSKQADHCEIEISEGAHLLLFGGKAFEDERKIDWNFVASNEALIRNAKERWKNREMPLVSGDDSYVPYPGT